MMPWWTDPRRFRSAMSALRHVVAGDPVPVFASLEVTRRCRRSCLYCASPRADDEPELSLSAWRAILDDLAESGALAVSVTGGEPLERPDVVEICDHARARGLFVGLNTNAILLPERREVLTRVNRITLSLDGVREVNDHVRGAGAFVSVEGAIALAREAGVPTAFTAVLSRRSVGRLDEFLAWVAERRVPVLFQPAYEDLLRSDGLANPQRPDESAMRAALERLLAAKEAGVPVQNTRTALRRMLGRDGEIRCHGGRLFVRVTASGDLEVCGLRGDPSPRGLQASGGIVSGMRRILATPNRCTRCESAARVEVNLLASLDPGAWWERVRGIIPGGRA